MGELKKETLLKIVGLALALIIIPLGIISADEEPGALIPSVLIGEIQTHGSNENDQNDTAYEFVELYNNSNTPISLDGWRLEFRNTAGGASRFLAEFNDDPELSIEYTIGAGEFFIISRENFLPNADHFIETSHGLNMPGGTVWLLDSAGEVVDKVGYGPSVNYLGSPAPAPGSDESIYRCFVEGEMINTFNNGDDFAISEHPLPGEGYDCPEPVEEALPPETNTDCAAVVIAELLPNPTGPRSLFPRADYAFIELYNPQPEPITLSGCGLKVAGKSHIHWFSTEHAEILAPEEYRAFYERDTKLALPVSPSGTVYLLSTQEVELMSTTYPANMPEGAAWAWFGNDNWQITYAPTPDELNVLLTEKPLPPCPEGQERNPETNRCRNIPVEAALADCGPGRERNPETNRCRNIPAATSLVDCGPGRERNPETNRCRNINPAGSNLVPCGPNQERNPETNRCRNIVLANDQALTEIQDVLSAQAAVPPNWWLAGFALAFAVGYGLWEWRYDVLNLGLNYHDKLKNKPTYNKLLEKLKQLAQR